MLYVTAGVPVYVDARYHHDQCALQKLLEEIIFVGCSCVPVVWLVHAMSGISDCTLDRYLDSAAEMHTCYYLCIMHVL